MRAKLPNARGLAKRPMITPSVPIIESGWTTNAGSVVACGLGRANVTPQVLREQEVRDHVRDVAARVGRDLAEECARRAPRSPVA